MTQTPENIQCFANTKKICPLREAKARFDELTECFYDGGTTGQGYGDDILDLAKSLSPFNRGRFLLMTGLNEGEEVAVLKPETCPPDGPRKMGIFFGKAICNAAIEKLE